jgi:hypothetical protein
LFAPESSRDRRILSRDADSSAHGCKNVTSKNFGERLRSAQFINQKFNSLEGKPETWLNRLRLDNMFDRAIVQIPYAKHSPQINRNATC